MTLPLLLHVLSLLCAITIKGNCRLFYLLLITGMTVVCIKLDVGVLVVHMRFVQKVSGLEL